MRTLFISAAVLARSSLARAVVMPASKREWMASRGKRIVLISIGIGMAAAMFAANDSILKNVT